MVFKLSVTYRAVSLVSTQKVYTKTKEQMEAELRLEYESYLELEKSVLFNLGLTKVSEKVSYLDMA